MMKQSPPNQGLNFEMKQLSGQDNSFLEIEDIGIPQHVASVAIYDQSTAKDGIVRFKGILDHLESRLHLSPIFRSKLHHVPGSLDRPYLIDDPDFDLEYHVRHIALPQPGDWRQLCILLARINSRPLDMSRPLWEFYVIEGLNKIEDIPEGSFALLTRIHHCVIDGASGVELMAAIHDIGPEPRSIEPEEMRIVHRPPSNIAMLGRAYLNTLLRPRRIAQLGIQLIGNRRSTGREQVERTKMKERKVSTRFNGKLSAHRVLDTVTFDFAEVRAIKNTLEGATINDVILTVVSGALHKYLASKGELPEESLTCGCPIDVREESERNTGGNMIGFMGVNLATLVEDPLERFNLVHDHASEAKNYAQASGTRVTSEIMEAVPGGIMAAAVQVSAAMSINLTPFNTILTNVPGTPYQLYFAGAREVSGFGIGPLLPNVGLFHTAGSSVMNKIGVITMSFWACREMMPDPEFYRQCIEDSYLELRKATIS